MFTLGRNRDPDRIRWCLNRKANTSHRFAIRIFIFFSALLLTPGIIFSSPRASGQSASPHSPQQKEKAGESPALPSPQELYKRLSPSVFVVEALDASGSIVMTGSAVTLAHDEVVTNRHVIEDGISWRVKRGSRVWPATIIHLDPDHDLCQLRAEGLKARPVEVRSSATLAVGERVFAIGAPEGLELTMSEGLVSGLREYENAHLIQTSAAISPGSSGGGLFDSQGRLVGITTFYLKEGQNLNFALPGEWIMTLAKLELPTGNAGTRDDPAFQAFIWFQAGHHADDAGDHLKAISAFKESIRLMPNNALSWNSLGMVYGELAQGDEAIKAYQEAVRLRPDDADNWNDLGRAYGASGQHDAAIKAFQEAIRLNSSDAAAWFNLGLSHRLLEHHDEAIKAFREAIRLKPGDAKSWFKLGLEYGGLKNDAEAIKAFQQTIRLEPEYWAAWHYLGVSCLGSHRDSEAIKAFREAIRLMPDRANTWYGLGLAYSEQGNRAKVMEVYEKLKQIDPDQADRFFQREVLP